MTQSKRINAAELDFDRIKESFKEYLKGQDKYSDYNFDGSNISILLDILAYNTHYNNLYDNFAINETNLDSASLRSSVVSIAKRHGYTPRSSIAPKAIVTLTVTNVSTGAPSILTIPKGTPFTTSNEGTTYTFATLKPYSAALEDDGYIFEGVEIYEGDYLTNRFVVADGVRYVIPNSGVDTTTLKVKVQESATSDSFETYSSVENFVSADRDSLVYFLKEVENGLYEVFFGEDIIGKQPSSGNVVTVEYVATNGELANGARNFSYSGDILAGGVTSVSTEELASSGKFPEPIESIKVNAPNSYSAQNRTVTSTDYKTLIYNKIPNIDSISVWGGENNVPVVYGKVFISIKPTGRNRLSDKEKSSITSLLKGKMVVAILIEFVDPELLDIIVETNVYYNPSKTIKTTDEVKMAVLEAIGTYNDENLNKFDGIYRHSTLTGLIDKSEKSVVSNITTIKLSKEFSPVIDQPVKKTISVYNPIEELSSTEFYVAGTEDLVSLKSNDSGEVWLISKNINSTEPTYVSKVGTINFDAGIINLEGFTVTDAPGNDIIIELIPQSYDVVSKLNQIASIDVSRSVVNMIVEDTENYIFTPSKN